MDWLIQLFYLCYAKKKKVLITKVLMSTTKIIEQIEINSYEKEGEGECF